MELSDLYYPNLEIIYHYVVLANFTISTMLFPLMVYIVITKSTKPMGEYKLLILNQLLWSYAFNVILIVWLPVPVLPFTIGYPIGIAKMLPTESFYGCFFAFVLCAIGTGHSVFVSFLYRVIKLKGDSAIGKFYSIKWLIFPARAITLAASMAIFMIPLILDNTNLSGIKAAIINESRTMEVYFTQQFNGIGGYHIKVGNGWIKIFFFELSSLCVLLFVAIAMIHTFFLCQMQKFRLHVSASTYRLHQMLYQALTIQLGLVTIELFAPLTAYFILYYFQIRNGSFYAIIFVTLTSFHSNCNFVVICYYIKPYRSFAFQKLTTFLHIIGCERASVASLSLSKSTQHAGNHMNTVY